MKKIDSLQSLQLISLQTADQVTELLHTMIKLGLVTNQAKNDARNHISHLKVCWEKVGEKVFVVNRMIERHFSRETLQFPCFDEVLKFPSMLF